jgi:hypothetical protein
VASISASSRNAAGGAALDRLEPSQLGQRDDRGRLAAEVDHLAGPDNGLIAVDRNWTGMAGVVAGLRPPVAFEV